MTVLYMLVGVPASGKSTWINSYQFIADPIVLSTDNYIEQQAAAAGKTYNEVFDAVIGDANDHLWKTAYSAFRANAVVVWDQTNLDVKGRRYKLSKVPVHYSKIAVYFNTPSREEHARRLNNRPGKAIPQQVINSMVARLTMPTMEEGFDHIIIV